MGAKGFSKYGLHELVEVGKWVDVPVETPREAERVRNAVMTFSTPRGWNLSVKLKPAEGVIRVTRKF